MTDKRVVRHLIEQYYDIQKMRIEAFNRIVCYVRDHADEILSHTQCVPGLHIASHENVETQNRNASQKYIETQNCYASQTRDGSHPRHASHHPVETHSYIADLEEPILLLQNKKYAEFVKKYLIKSHHGCETHIGTVFSKLFQELDTLIWYHNKLLETEKELYKRLDVWSRDHPLRKEYLSKIKGIGPVLASGIIAWLCDPILKANYVSQIWSYCGLAPGQVRRRGEKCNFNPFLKSFVVFRVGRSLLIHNKPAKKLYDAFKEDAKKKHPDWTKLHLHNHARRKVVKLFIASVWEVWRRMNNLPVTEPYPIAVLGHKDKITPDYWITRSK